MVGVGPGALGHLEDQGCADLLGGLGNALDDLHIVDIERADGIAAAVGLLKHFGCGNKGHVIVLLMVKLAIFYHIFFELQQASRKKLAAGPGQAL